jgi:hypothetical protein
MLSENSLMNELHDNARYYTGSKVAPVLTVVIGGNHEASNYMWELYVSSLSPLILTS